MTPERPGVTPDPGCRYRSAEAVSEPLLGSGLLLVRDGAGGRALGAVGAGVGAGAGVTGVAAGAAWHPEHPELLQPLQELHVLHVLQVLQP